MTNKFFKTITPLCFLMISAPIFGQESLRQNRALQKNASSIVEQYVKQLRSAGFKPPFVPSVVVQTKPQLIFYSKDDRQVTIPTWNGLGADEKKLFNDWAALAGDSLTGRSLFEEFFNWFFIPHEMSHYLFEELSPSWGSDHFENEKSANEFAVAFWLTQPKVKDRLDRVARAARRIQQGLPNPVPEGADPKRYFNENYEQLGQNPPAYGLLSAQVCGRCARRQRTFGLSFNGTGDDETNSSIATLSWLLR